MGNGIVPATPQEGRQGIIICALLYGEAKTADDADRTAGRYGSCPYVYLMATRGRQLFATFFLPKEQRWWIEYVEKNPEETFRLEKARVTLVDNVEYPKRLEARRTEKAQTIAPCGSNCGECPSFERCLGCPATVFHKRAGCGSSTGSS